MSCHVFDPRFAPGLLHIDLEFAAQTRAAGCSCGNVLHQANYPRKPRGCPSEVRADFSMRQSFCCSSCRKRTTSRSVRFLGRRVYVMLSVVLLSTRSIERMPIAAQLAGLLDVPQRTLHRWRQWWTEQFPQTPLWQAEGARCMPPPNTQQLPGSLLACFGAESVNTWLRLLVFLSPLSTRC